ncbi:hypothetical protein GCM10010502_49700 [Kitasatospora aureofaciens]|uniref:DUF4188 domain-containing protein n=1 Tax=Kitasatospora aureofaciens TaxID=1894 RepID=A0A8H9HVD9_KITAU|nr:hypothetical protein GCM10010502_49700 [Kitasatospora aureofaciens]
MSKGSTFVRSVFARPRPGYTTAAATGDTVVLLIGMRINRFWAVHHWGPVMYAMFRMLHELRRSPERGLRGRILLTASPRTYYVVQYWESKEALYRYSTAPDGFHHTVWGIANRKVREGRTRGHVGLWHETYVVPEGGYESIYFDMPAFGLAGATGQVPVEERGRHAAQRLAFRSGAGSGESARESVGESVGASTGESAGESAGTTEGTADGVDARADTPGVS